MIINGIEFPQEIINAINEDRLVIFVGAGVSTAAPTSLPSFKELAQAIGKKCGVEYCEDGKDSVDEFLGDLERKEKSVKKHVIDELKQTTNQPNYFHRALVHLFKNNDKIRIVTTNLDLMLETVLEEDGIDKKTYCAPALPYGDDFTGIVHIHGSVEDPKSIVITDTDFGEAYIRNGYAARFLIEIFKEYVVLFVGYSYEDRIVRYLTTAITAKNIPRAYMLNGWSEDEQSKLDRIGIKSITYLPGNHEQYRQAIETLGRYTKRGALDWKERINDFDIRRPPADPELRDELLNGLELMSTQKFFCEKIKSAEWPEWVDRNHLIDNLFDSQSVFSETDVIWAKWLAENYYSSELLMLIAKHNCVINERFINIIIDNLSKDKGDNGNHLLAIYIPIFLDQMKWDNTFCQLIRSTEERCMTEQMWLVFWNYCRFRIEITITTLPEKPIPWKRIKYKWEMNEDLFEYIWETHVSKHFDNPTSVLMKGTMVLDDLYSRLTSVDQNGDTIELDYLNIEKISNSLFTDKSAIVICESLERAYFIVLKDNKKYAHSWVETIIESRATLLRRLGLNILRKDSSISTKRKAQIVLKHFSLHELPERQQLFGIIADIYDGLDALTQEIILEKIWNVDTTGWRIREGEEKTRTKYYMRFNWLCWLNSKCKKTDLIKTKIEIIKNKYSDFEPREHPELVFENTVTKWGNESPITPDDLYNMPINKAFEYIRDYKPDIFDMGPDRLGLMGTVTEICTKDKNWGLALTSQLESSNRWDDDIWDAIFRGFEESAKTEGEFTKILDKVTDKIKQHKPLCILKFINSFTEHEMQIKTLEETTLIKLLDVLSYLWGHRTEARVEGDWLTKSLNNSTGLLSYSLLNIVHFHNLEKGIPAWFKDYVNKHIQGSKDIQEYICAICRYAAVLYYKDSDWTRENVLPYLKDCNESYKEAAWIGILSGVASYNIDFGSEIWPLLKENASVKDSLNDDFNNAFVHTYTLLLTYVSDDPLKEAREFINILSDKERRHFAHSINSIIRNMKPDAKEKMWENWLKDYWMYRNDNIPAKISNNEYEIMLNWLLELGNFKETIKVALESRVKGIAPTFFLYELEERGFIEAYPEECAMLIVKIVKSSDKKILTPNIRATVDKLKEKEMSKELKNALLECFD